MRKQVIIKGWRTFCSFSAAFCRKLQKNSGRIAAVLLCTFFIMCLCSCWSQRELGKLAIVVGAGFDVGDEEDSFKLTTQIIKASAMGSGSAAKGGGEDKAYVNISYTDKSMLSAVREITRMQNRKPYFPHSDLLIFGSELAKVDMAEGIDAFARDYEGRLNVYILIAKGTASEILEEDVDLEKAPALHIAGMMENQYENSETVVVTLRDFLIATLSDSASPVAPMIELYEIQEKKYARLNGTAVFKQEKMIGELNTAQTRGLLYVTNKAKSSAMAVETQWGQVILEIVGCSSSLKPVKTGDGDIKMELKLDVSAVIESNETYEDMSKMENIDMLKEKMKEYLRSDIEGALLNARALSADIFGFGELIFQEYPDEWEAMAENWEEEFPNIELDIQINTEIRSTGGLARPVVPGGTK